jgi:hypothetical protein
VFFLVRDLRDALFAGVVVLALGLVVMQAIQRRYRHLVRRAVMPAVCAAIGDLSHDVGGASDLNLGELARIGLVPGHCRARFDDVFHGRYRATGFTMAEVRLRRDGHGRRRRSRSVFHGVIFAIETPRPVPARILIAQDGGMIGNGFKGLVRKFGGMQRVALPDPVFEQCFEVYADRPEVARAMVTAELRANLVALAEAHRGARFQVALADGRLFLAMPRRGDLFAAGSLFRSTGQLEGEAARLLEDVQVVHRVIDYLHGDRPGLRPQAKERSASPPVRWYALERRLRPHGAGRRALVLPISR